MIEDAFTKASNQLLLSQLRNLEDLMRRHAETAWADKLRDIQFAGAKDPQELKRLVLNMYKGSMGSLTDLIICRVNGHNVDDQEAVNAELDRMTHEIYETASSL
jgi:hypothetical protein